jgi:small conductance mechanosensitive channel
LVSSGTLQNFAGGVIILILKPFKLGDFIDAQGYTGTVRDYHFFHYAEHT